VTVTAFDITQCCRTINALVRKLAKAEDKVDQYQRSIGQHIAAIKAERPDDWLQVVESECALGRSRAYELLAIANGRKTTAQVAAASTERSKKHRALSPLRNGPLHKADPVVTDAPAPPSSEEEIERAAQREREHRGRNDLILSPITEAEEEIERAAAAVAHLLIKREPDIARQIHEFGDDHWWPFVEALRLEFRSTTCPMPVGDDTDAQATADRRKLEYAVLDKAPST
jgi:hypothetical protein